MKINFENKEFNLSQNEIKVFFATVKTQENVEFFVKLNGVEGECLSCSGKDYLGNVFSRNVELKANEEKKLWFYIKSPCEVVEKQFYVEFYDNANLLIHKHQILLKTKKSVIGNDQFDDLISMRRLAWLNSDYAINSQIPAPFIPMQLNDNKISFLGREIIVGNLGLPISLGSYFTQGIKIGKVKKDILSNPIRFEISGQKFSNEKLSVVPQKNKATISATNSSEDFTWEIQSQAEFDGFVSYKMAFTAKREIKVQDMRLVIPVQEDCQKYFMGLGKNGGLFNKELNWKWNAEKQQDGFWAGDVNAGMKIQFKDENYRKPLVNIYYAHKPLILPEGWANNGSGGIKFQNGEFIAYTGERIFAKNQTIRLDFTFIITPLKEIDIKKQLQMRFYHKLDGQPEEWLKIAKEKNAKLINVHHGNDLNPYINYPFFEKEALSDFVKQAHDNDIKVKIYYTIRELTINTPEFQILREVDDEIFEKYNKNVEGNFWQSEAKEWIRKQIGEDVIPAWRQVLHGEKYKDEYDSSVITNGTSRLCNFYIEGLRRLLQTTDLDGLYIDDVAFDRNTMKRVRKVLNEREGRYIDFHTWNHNFNDLAGNTSCTYLYAELLPYIDKLWIGEGFDYDSPYDFWLVEISGIPFGLMSEMLEADWQQANQWKGLVFGMTTRLGWTDETNMADPTNIWKIFDEYGLENSEFIGFWDTRNEVECNSPNVKATLYKNGDKKYIALANFSNENEKVRIKINNSSNYTLYCPYIERFQEETMLGEEIFITANKGLFIVVKE